MTDRVYNWEKNKEHLLKVYPSVSLYIAWIVLMSFIPVLTM